MYRKDLIAKIELLGVGKSCIKIGWQLTVVVVVAVACSQQAMVFLKLCI
jgi:hypothetical protein